jgi:hypothetical protein
MFHFYVGYFSVTVTTIERGFFLEAYKSAQGLWYNVTVGLGFGVCVISIRKKRQCMKTTTSG